jgi:hypothetical protein
MAPTCKSDVNKFRFGPLHPQIYPGIQKTLNRISEICLDYLLGAQCLLGTVPGTEVQVFPMPSCRDI